MRFWWIIGFGLGAYVLALVAMAPATLIDSRLRLASEGRVRLAEARGTLWSGTGQIEVRDANERAVLARSVAWRARPGHLFLGRLRYDISVDHAAKRFPVTITPARVHVADADINLPAAALGLAIPKMAPLELTGDVMLQVGQLGISQGAVQGNVTLQWRAAGSGLAPVSPLGDYELRLNGEGSALRASLRTLQGPLQLEGQGSWSAGGRLEFLGTARVPAQHYQQLAPLLRLIAVERGDGSFALELK